MIFTFMPALLEEVRLKKKEREPHQVCLSSALSGSVSRGIEALLIVIESLQTPQWRVVSKEEED